MKCSKPVGYMLIAYCIPYLVFIYLLTYYFDYIAQQYPAFLPPIVLILILALIYIGLGCICGRKGLSRICILGTVIQLSISKVCISYIIPTFNIKTGGIEAWFPIIVGFIIVCQLIGYWGTKELEAALG